MIENVQNFKIKNGTNYNADYLIAAAQHHLKIADHLQFDYLDDSMGNTYQPLTKLQDLTKVKKLRAIIVRSNFQFLFLSLFNLSLLLIWSFLDSFVFAFKAYSYFIAI